MKTLDRKRGGGLGWIMAVYLLGIFMGAIDTGIVSPARTIIQGVLGVDEKTGIWMITVYTLAYAAIIPISGKLADRLGRKYVYVASVALFGTGSLICGLSNFAGSFPLLLTGRVIQALGGGGIMPVATAEFGTSFPPEKRGMALGLVGGTYGVANILGSTIGSAILNAFGNNNWQMLFFVNLPICVFIIVAGLMALPNTRMDKVKRIDGVGTLLLVGMILSLLYGLRNIDFFNFSASIRTTDVYPFLIAFVVLLPFFLLAEKKADDPILALRYFTQKNTLTTLVLSFLVGMCMMGMIFVPQFSENALRIGTGSGGYFVAILGVFAGLAAPLGGVLIDRFGPKKVLFFGFGVTLIGALFLSFVAIPIGNWFTVIASLVVMGFGLGFTIGTPLNYMMLDNTPKEESNSALAALSLVRSIGTAIAPAIMIGFLAQAGTTTQSTLMNMLPQPQAPKIALAESLNEDFNRLKADPNLAEMLKKVQIPDFSTMGSGSMNFSMTGGTLPKNLADSMQTADVTNIVDRVKNMAAYMYNDKTSKVIIDIQNGIQTGLTNFGTGLTQLDKQKSSLEDGIKGVQTAIDGMKQGIAGADKGIKQLQGGIAGMDGSIAQAVAKGAPVTQIDALKVQKKQLQTGLDGAIAKKGTLEGTLAETQGKLTGMQQAVASMEKTKADMLAIQTKMQTLKDSIPGVFQQTEQEYLNTLDKMKPDIESAFQSGLNTGFKGMYITVAIAALIASAVLAFYRSRRKNVLTEAAA
jgi:EmrB/QacA subfamily drug resistance transporter